MMHKRPQGTAHLRAGGDRLPDRLMGACSAARSALGEPGPAVRAAALGSGPPSRLAASLLAPDSWASSWLHCLSAVLASMAGVAKPQSSISCCTCSHTASVALLQLWLGGCPRHQRPQRRCSDLTLLKRVSDMLLGQCIQQPEAVQLYKAASCS